MSFFDETRDNINVQKLNEDERKELFKNFVDAGGEVVQKKKKKPMIINREKQREMSEKMDRHYSSKKKNIENRSKRIQSSKTVPDNIKKTSKENIIITLFNRFRIRINLSTKGISDFSTTIFKQHFFEKYNSEYKPALIELQMLFIDIFKQNIVLGNRVMEQLDNVRPLYFELIEMTADLFDKTINGQLIDSYIAFPEEQQNIIDYRNPILAYFKKIYPLYPYADMIYTSYEKAISLQQKFKKQGKSSEYSAKRKKMKNNLYIVFHKFLPSLYWLFCKYHGSVIPLTSRNEIEQILLIGPDMIPGNRVAAEPSRIDPQNINRTVDQRQKEEEEELEKAREELKKNTIETIPPHVEKGLRELRKLNPTQLQKKYAVKDKNASKMDLNDKVFMSYLYLCEFDHQYAFLLSTNKIKYNTVTGKNNQRINFKDILETYFNALNKVYDTYKQYFTSVETYNKAKEDKPISNDQYIKYSKRFTQAEKERKSRGGAARHALNSYMQKLINTLEKILKNIENADNIVQNSKEPLAFDTSVEGNTKLKGMTVHEAFQFIYEFCAGISYSLSPAGELSGEIEFKTKDDSKDDDNFLDDPAEDSLLSSASENKSLSKAEKSKEIGGSVMSELDDLL